MGLVHSVFLVDTQPPTQVLNNQETLGSTLTKTTTNLQAEQYHHNNLKLTLNSVEIVRYVLLRGVCSIKLSKIF